jgi:hypothetical protein
MRRFAAVAVIVSLFGTPPLLRASTEQDGASPEQSSTPPRIDPDKLPVSIERIQRELGRDPAIVLPESNPNRTDLPTFRVAVQGQKLTIEQILGPDYLRGPVPAGAMTHQEFLNLVTPQDVQGYAAFSNGQGITVALTSLALQWALKSALQKFHEARDARAKAAAKKEVDEALEALRKARIAAGLSADGR